MPLVLVMALLALSFAGSAVSAQRRTEILNTPIGAKCADEGGRCNFDGPGTVYYGAGKNWVARPNSPSGIRCTNEVFGDPAPNQVKSCYYVVTRRDLEGVRCAEENQTCRFSGRGAVYYGVGDAWVFQVHNDGVVCSNDVFGDPAPNRVKSCFVVTQSGLPRGTRCGNEGQRCRFRGPATVHYGAGAAWVSKGFVDGVVCSNDAFGDPSPDVVKSCYVELGVSAPEGSRCASEGGLCRFQGTGTVYYGAGRSWVYQRLNGPVECSNEVFGDPFFNTAKSCFVMVNQRRRSR